MNLSPYIDRLRHDLAVAAHAGGDDARALAERLTAPLESAAQLVLLEALSAAADEITAELAPGSVEVRLHGREPNFVVTPPPADDGAAGGLSHPASQQLSHSGAAGGVTPDSASAAGDEPAASGSPTSLGADGGTSRLNLRLPDSLKARIEEAARQEGLSLNAWLVRAAAAALEAGNRRSDRRTPRGGQHYTGWVR